MIKAEIGEKQGTQKIVATGTIIDILTDVGVLINRLYQSMAKKDEGAAELFKAEIRRLIGSDNAPMFEKSSQGTGVTFVNMEVKGDKQRNDN